MNKIALLEVKLLESIIYEQDEDDLIEDLQKCEKMRKQLFESFKMFVMFAIPPPPAIENCGAIFIVVEDDKEGEMSEE